ncbi:hypothetical protein EZV62_003418 [Acer yangbiense]|uniref:DUF4220 domain-containing protein n=1 Tax=Acer yangbiense TaxID=1000413 RepID=A0A5C7IGT6_9ROSI|nr:hypothetical protein EZV62_003418 [Acer yangbiense]
MEIFPETLKKLWNLWEIRSLLLLSLSLQIILIVFGSRRKINYSHSWIGILLNVIVWCAYISADWVATVALSVMASNEADCGQVSSKAADSLQAFWAPFLLLHLGGPDTITAYSLEDNELWLRHLLGLIVEVGVAFYVFLRFWSSNVLTLLSIPVFITGIVKYGERTWVLWSLSSKRFKDSLGSSSDPDPCIDLFYEYKPVGLRLVMKAGIGREDRNLVQAYYSYKRLLYLFANQIIDEKRYHSYDIIKRKSAEDAFKLVAIELGLIYDVLYTKAAIVYSRIGISLRCISFIFSVSALVLFSIIIDMHSYPQIDITVTYLLLAGAVLLEIYAFTVLFSSDWTKLWLIKFKVAEHWQISEPLVDKFWKFSSFLHSCSSSKKRWSESMGQYNLMNSALKERQRAYLGHEKFSCTSKLLENYQYLTWENVDIGLRERIFRYLKKIAYELQYTEVISFHQGLDEQLSNKGEYALKHYGFGDLLVGNEFDQRIIIWHIVTDECYKDDLHHVHGDANKLDQNCKISTWLSDYMLYLMLFRPSMLPKGIGEIRYDHTCVDAVRTYGVLPSKHGRRAKKGITSNNCHLSLFKQANNCLSLLFEQAQGLFNQAQVEQAQGLVKQAQGEQAEGLFEQARSLFKQTFDLLKQTRYELAHEQAQGLLKQAQVEQAQGEKIKGLLELKLCLFKLADAKDLLQAKVEQAMGMLKQSEDLLKQAQARDLFKQAQGLDSHFRDFENGGKRRWKMISEVWLEMLAYAAQNCDWKEHAQHLRNGGELLTHVSVLMVNFRLNKQVM